MHMSIYMKIIYTDVINKRRAHGMAEYNGFLTCFFVYQSFFMKEVSVLKRCPGGRWSVETTTTWTRASPGGWRLSDEAARGETQPCWTSVLSPSVQLACRNDKTDVRRVKQEADNDAEAHTDPGSCFCVAATAQTRRHH